MYYTDVYNKANTNGYSKGTNEHDNYLFTFCADYVSIELYVMNMRKEVKSVKTALGMIVRSIDSETELMGFVENAEKYGHKLDCVIIAYTLTHDPNVEYKLSKKLPYFAININNPHYCKEQLSKRGISESAVKELIECPIDTKAGLVPYGFNRMIVVMEAILRDIDTLFFIDSDVYPRVLKKKQDEVVYEEIDFFGAHLEHLNSGVQVTTGEYSGYNILPPASFKSMDDLLIGVQKPEMKEYWETSEKHRCLVTQVDETEAKPCEKVLGGNMAIKLSAFADLPPFFSSHYTMDGELFLCRGEDTMLGLEIAKGGVKCMDIGLNPLHDTYKDFPAEPNLRDDKSTQNRFYYACTGWVGRNPLLNHILGNDIQKTKEKQRVHLEKGLEGLAEYTSNPKFKTVINNFDISWDNLDKYINEFKHVSEAWNNFKKGVNLV